MARRVRWILVAATLVAALAPTATAGAALRGRVVQIEAFGVPSARPSARHAGSRTFRIRSPRRPHSRGVDDEHVAPIPVPGEAISRRVGRVAIVVADARPSER
jgi:hypothetical protein